MCKPLVASSGISKNIPITQAQKCGSVLISTFLGNKHALFVFLGGFSLLEYLMDVFLWLQRE